MEPSYDWQSKPGNRVHRIPRIKPFRLRRVLGIPALFSAGYGDVGSSIYYALGIVAIAALGATPIALAAAGIIYILNALSYAEGGAAIPEAGGSASFARHGINRFTGFIAGWALMLSYIVTMAISAYTIPPYLAHFWPILNNSTVDTAVAIGIIVFLMTINVLGVRESSRLNILFIIMDITTQITLIVLGVILILAVNPAVLFEHMFGAGNWPSTSHLVYGIAIAALCFTGVETISQLAEETKRPAARIPKTYMMMIVAVLVIFAGISIVALAAMTPQMLGDPTNGWARDPVAGIAANLPLEILRKIFAPIVAVLAASILLTATNAGLLGISRLAFNLSSHQLLPSIFGRVHRRFHTPYFSIIFFCCLSASLLIPSLAQPNFFEELGALYVFGSLLCFALAHAAILGLRIREPDLPRPFKLRGNLKIKGRELPFVSILGLLATSTIWIVVIISQPFSRWAGIVWMFLGMILYFIYRLSQNISARRKQMDELIYKK
jgi:APA family basic amino acid/polyamine antiporter